MASKSEKEFIKIYIEPENRGKKLNLTSIEENVHRDTTISQLREYLVEIRCKQGTLQLEEKKIYQTSTLAELHVADGSTFTLKNCLSKNDNSLREVTMKILPDSLTFTIMLPPKISFKLLKFAIECKSFVLASNQVFRKHGEPVKWEENYKCSREELQTVTISDSSKSTIMQDSPKSDLKLFLNEHQPKSNSDSEDGSSTNLIIPTCESPNKEEGAVGGDVAGSTQSADGASRDEGVHRLRRRFPTTIDRSEQKMSKKKK